GARLGRRRRREAVRSLARASGRGRRTTASGATYSQAGARTATGTVSTIDGTHAAKTAIARTTTATGVRSRRGMANHVTITRIAWTRRRVRPDSMTTPLED